MTTFLTRLLPVAALALASCSQEPTYEADAVDQSGGELIVTTPTPSAVPVEEPTTPMTMGPEGAATPMGTPIATAMPE